VGFAAETSDLAAHARKKLDAKKLDAVIANDVSRSDIGFNSDNNQVLLVDREGTEELPLMGKSQLARLLISKLAGKL